MTGTAIKAEAAIVRQMGGIMKKASILPMACLLAVTVFAQSNQKTDAQQAELAGPVKIVKTLKTTRSAESIGIEDNFAGYTSDVTTIYNRAGNKTEEVVSGTGGDVLARKVFNYDSSGKLVSAVNYDDRGAVDGKYVYTHDPVKNEVAESYYNPQGEYLSKIVSSYNDKGELVRYSYYETKGILVNEISTKPSADGIGVETTWLKTHGEFWFRTVTVERDNGKAVETITYEPDGALSSKSIARNNDDGAETRVTEYDANGAIKRIYSITRTLDSHGNWVLMNRFKEDPKDGSKRLIDTTSRTITYY